jgi:hypothetical protein
MRALGGAKGGALHVECLLHHNRIITIEQMPIIRDIAKAIHRAIRVSGGMEQRQCAI